MHLAVCQGPLANESQAGWHQARALGVVCLSREYHTDAVGRYPEATRPQKRIPMFPTFLLQEREASLCLTAVTRLGRVLNA
jgi:hypothetical protein